MTIIKLTAVTISIMLGAYITLINFYVLCNFIDHKKERNVTVLNWMHIIFMNIFCIYGIYTFILNILK